MDETNLNNDSKSLVGGVLALGFILREASGIR